MSTMTWEQQVDYLRAHAADADNRGMHLFAEAIREALRRAGAPPAKVSALVATERTMPDGTTQPAPRWTFRETLEQAHALYSIQHKEAVDAEDPQGENFWASHAETVRSVLDTIELCPACEEKGLRP